MRDRVTEYVARGSGHGRVESSTKEVGSYELCVGFREETMPDLSKDDGRRVEAGLGEPSVPFQRTPSRYADAFLEQIGIKSLKDWYRALINDEGVPVSVIEKRLGEGISWLNSSDAKAHHAASRWLVLERLPENGTSVLRARVFGSLVGATAEFCLKLKTHDSGCVAFHEIRGGLPRASDVYFQLEFNSPTRQMLLSHASVAMEAASRLMVS